MYGDVAGDSGRPGPLCRFREGFTFTQMRAPLLLLALVLPLNLFAAESEQERLVRQILQEQGVLIQMRAGLQAQIELTKQKNPWLPPETIQKLENSIQEDQMVKELLPVWNKRFNLTELQDLLRFAKTSAGRKYFQSNQKMTAESGLILSLYGLRIYKTLVTLHPDRFKNSVELERQIQDAKRKLELP